MSEKPQDVVDDGGPLDDGMDDACPACGGGDEPDLWESACWDDLCHGGEVPCMHGDYSRLPCSICGK